MWFMCMKMFIESIEYDCVYGALRGVHRLDQIYTYTIYALILYVYGERNDILLVNIINGRLCR